MFTYLFILILYLSASNAQSIIENSQLNLTQIAWKSPKTKTYLGSPSIVKLPNGIMLASHDTFHHQPIGHVHVYRSMDNGSTWDQLSIVKGCYWANLWTIGNEVYMLGTWGDYENPSLHSVPPKLLFVGLALPMVFVALPILSFVSKKKAGAINITLVVTAMLVIAILVWQLSNSSSHNPVTIFRSTDNGETWTGGEIIPGTWATGPMPTIEYQGFYVRSMEYKYSLEWGYFNASLIFAPIGHDLMRPETWLYTKPLAFDPKWIPESWGLVSNLTFLEGNAVVGPDGTLYNILRVRINPLINKACVLQYDPYTFTLQFKQFIDFPGGQSKFVIRQDPQTKYYISLSNPATDEFPSARNILKFSYSKDLFNWTMAPTLLWDDTGLSPEQSAQLTGFHYVDWHIDEEDIIYVIRTACQGADSYHNSNRITYKRLDNFRSLLPLG